MMGSDAGNNVQKNAFQNFYGPKFVGPKSVKKSLLNPAMLSDGRSGISQTCVNFL